MIRFPGSKINIGLNIIGKRPDGYHDLESVFYPLNLSDILEITVNDHFEFFTSGLSINGDHSDNLVAKAYYLLQDIFDLPPVKIHLHKIVPMGAGLGGGSADGAATLLLLNDLFSLNISLEQLEKYADQLGSDCAFFIRNKPAFVQGKGEQITLLNITLSGCYIQLINPDIHISTQEAFSGIVPMAASPNWQLKTQESPLTWQQEVKNDFEKTIFPLHPEIEALKNELYNQGASYASMTGTGSSVYAIFEKEPLSLKGNKVMKKTYFEWIADL